ncbi:hypothetical protein GCM10022409_19190 [Hymenobacter glaciei]|uniref:Uncharacterized protein n=1 Tax=Hymenobacter glaciei TaxID=877209 RepID=A0ABP7U2Q9_9BACT
MPALQEWVDEVIRGQRWEHFDDLHVDELDSQFRRPGRWMEASVMVLEVLEQLIARQNYQILLIIHLATTSVSAAGQPIDRLPLEDALGHTPPSFYLFPQPSDVVTQTVQAAVQLPDLSQQLQRAVYFQEQYEDGEYDPSLLILSTTLKAEHSA